MSSPFQSGAPSAAPSGAVCKSLPFTFGEFTTASTQSTQSTRPTPFTFGVPPPVEKKKEESDGPRPATSAAPSGTPCRSLPFTFGEFTTAPPRPTPFTFGVPPPVEKKEEESDSPRPATWKSERKTRMVAAIMETRAEDLARTPWDKPKS